MSKHHSPLLGYNNNVKHKGKVFHIQTEDSGVKHPHIITHIFMDGGRILKSQKTSYAEHVGADGMAETVRRMMKEQHKAMFTALREGQFDPLIPSSGASMPPPPPARAPSAPPRRPEAHPQAAADAAPPSDAAPMTQREAAPPLTIDFDSLGSAVPDGEPELPPPPAQLFRKAAPEPGTGSRYRTVADPRVDPDSSSELRAAPPTGDVPPSRVDRVDLDAPKRRSAPPPRSERAPPRRPEPKPASARGARASEPAGERKRRSSRPPRSQGDGARHAPARPAAIFGGRAPEAAEPRQSSIFGEDLISDKSLDEVILSYLAEDLEGEK